MFLKRLLVLVLLSCSIALLGQELTPKEKAKQEQLALLATQYDKLSAAIASDDITLVKELFRAKAGLEEYAKMHEDGTPLHFVRSLAMAQFLVEKMGFDANRCDQYGEVPAQALEYTQAKFFPHPAEKPQIVAYFKGHKLSFARRYYQYLYNKNLHHKTALFGLSVFLAVVNAYVISRLAC